MKFLVLVSLLGLAAGLAASPAAAAAMATIPGGSYKPFYSLGKNKGPVKVSAFSLDVYPVSNADFLAFVKTRPQWQKSRVKAIFADRQYLGHWSGNLNLAPALASSPVINVSWFAAQAYCKAQGKQLPTIDQWEFAARASETKTDASRDPTFSRQLLDWYGQPTPARLPPVGRKRNVYGVYDLHGLVWEWNRDFNSIMLSGESREDAGLNRNLYCAGGVAAGADPSDYASYMRFAFRSSLEARYTVQNLGFRCAKEKS